MRDRLVLPQDEHFGTVGAEVALIKKVIFLWQF